MDKAGSDRTDDTDAKSSFSIVKIVSKNFYVDTSKKLLFSVPHSAVYLIKG